MALTFASTTVWTHWRTTNRSWPMTAWCILMLSDPFSEGCEFPAQYFFFYCPYLKGIWMFTVPSFFNASANRSFKISLVEFFAFIDKENACTNKHGNILSVLTVMFNLETLCTSQLHHFVDALYVRTVQSETYPIFKLRVPLGVLKFLWLIWRCFVGH